MGDRKTFFRQLAAIGLGGWSVLSGFPAPKGDPSVKPRRLRKGDTIALVSPAGILPERGRYGEIAETIRGLGYRVVTGSNARNRHGYLAGTDRERVDDLHAAFADPSVDAIMAFRGGWGSNRLLPLLDFDLISEHPKPLIGFSDITSLLLAIYRKTGLVTFHGPVGKSEWNAFTRTSFRQSLEQKKPHLLKNGGDCSDCLPVRTIRGGRSEGVLLGGNLTVLTSMIGSDYLPDFTGCLLFLEDVGEDYYRIDRMLMQLRLSGILEGIGGFVFGDCTDCRKGNPWSQELEQILEDHIKPIGVPAFSGLQFGHSDKNLTIPVGIRARMDADSGTIQLLESPTAS